MRQLRGNPGGRPAPRRLKLPPKAPASPSWMSGEAKAEWRRVVPELDRMGVLATVDRAVLAAYCTSWSRFHEAEMALRKTGLVNRRSDRDSKSPVWQVWREAAIQVREFAKELYLTPTSRLRSEIPEGGAGGSSADGEDDILD